MPQRNKGDRHLIQTRVPRCVYDALVAQAHERGYRYMSDYLAAVAARDVAMPEHAPAGEGAAQREELPLTG